MVFMQYDWWQYGLYIGLELVITSDIFFSYYHKLILQNSAQYKKALRQDDPVNALQAKTQKILS